MSRFKVLLFSLLLFLPLAVQSASIVEGFEYKRIVPAQQTQAPAGKIEVIELFWYGCPHCYRFEPSLSAWLKNKPADVVFKRIPAQLNPGWVIHAQAFYTAEALGVGDKMHHKLFEAMHKSKRKLKTADEIAALFVENGISKKKFDKVFNSFGVKTKMANARGMVQRYGANSVPTIIVNGKYRSDATSAGGTHKDLINVVNFLINKERSK